MTGWQPQQYDPRQHQQRVQGQPWQQPIRYAPQGYGQQQQQQQQYWPQPQAHRPPQIVPGRPSPAFPRYPWRLLPGYRRRRHSVFYYVWLGSHPVLALISLMISVYIWAFLVAWVAAITMGWLLCCAAILVSLPFRHASRANRA